MNSEYRMQQGSSWDSGNLTGMSQKQLLQYITEMGFAVDDLVLYLDTHENDCEAIKLCNMYGKKELSPQVRCVAGEYMGGVFPISKEEPIQIGRDSTWANLVLASEKVSDRQVSIRYLPEKDFFMITNYSEEGTFLRSGECLIKNVEQVCLNGVILCFGDNKEQFRLEGKKRYS